MCGTLTVCRLLADHDHGVRQAQEERRPSDDEAGRDALLPHQQLVVAQRRRPRHVRRRCACRKAIWLLDERSDEPRSSCKISRFSVIH